MEIKDARFVKSSTNLSQCPGGEQPEFAFIGRSNVGKSSLINMLCGRKHLAKTSSKPGKTQMINHFDIDEKWYIVDLPGYGWSAVSKKQKAQWGVMIEEYLLKRKSLACVFVLLDARHEPQKIDYDFIHWLGTSAIPLCLVFTKTDKLGKTRFQSIHKKHVKILKEDWELLPPMFFTSAEVGTGRDDLLQFIGKTLQKV